MNLNHDPDKHLLEQIDKRLESGQPSGNALVDELASTRPIPRPAAQSALEERLLAQLELQNQGENSMASTTTYITIDAPHRNWLPLTLLAALIVVAIAGLMLINGIGKSPKSNEMALAGATTTPTPVPTVRIVVAYQNLPRGFFFSDNKVDMQTVAYYAAWPADSVPFDALREDAKGIDQLQGKILRAHVYSQQPITLSNLEEVHSSTSDLNAINILPSDRVPVELSRAQITDDGIVLVEGDLVNIVALLPSSRSNITQGLQVTHTPDGKQLIASRVVLGALVAFMGSWPQRQIDSTNTPPDPSQITFAVPPDQAGLLTWLATQGITFKLELVKPADVLLPTPALQPPIPIGKIAIEVPLASIQIIPQITDLQAGKSVDVIATFLSVDNDDSTPTNPPQVLTLQPGQTTDLITKRIAQGAVIIKAGDILTLAASPDEANDIQEAITANLSMKLRPVSSADTVVPPPSYSIDLNLDSVSHWAADDLRVGDKVDVIVGLVLGNGSNLKLEFKPYAEYNWIGTPFNGINSARTYIPVNPNSQSGVIFLRRILQNATVIAIRSRIDPNTSQVQTVGLTIEVQSETASTDGSSLKQWVDVGMPYLVVKH